MLNYYLFVVKTLVLCYKTDKLTRDAERTLSQTLIGIHVG